MSEEIMSERRTLEALAKQVELFERAAAYAGYPREKLVALGEAEELYFRMHPRHYMAQQTMRMATQIGRLVRMGEDPFGHSDRCLISLLMRITLEELRGGGLRLRDQHRPTELVFTLWSLASGTRSLIGTGVINRQLGVNNGFNVARDATEMLLDALGWMPLSHEWDYEETRKRIRQELFGKEWDQVQAKNGDSSRGTFVEKE
jgi:hypothetical protein